MENSKKIKKSKFMMIILYIILQFVFLLFFYKVNSLQYYEWLKDFTLVLLFQICSTFYFFIKFKIKLISLSSFAIILTYLFHFGQIVILATFPKFPGNQQDDFIKILDFTTIKFVAIYSIMTIMLIILGMLISSHNTDADDIKNNSVIKENINYSRTKIIGWILVVSCFPIQIYIDLKKMNSFVDYGYLAVFQSAVSGYIGELGFLAFTGFAMLILAYSKKNKVVSFCIFTFIVIYLLLTMATGGRGKQLTFLLLYVYIFHNSLVKINWKKFIIVILFGVFVAGILNTVAIFRALPDKNLDTFFTIFLETFDENPVIGIIYELGGTIQTPYQTVMQVPKMTPLGYGTTYFYSLFSILPNLGDTMNNLNEYSHYVKNIRGSALGGSIIGELYYNFQFFGLMFAPFIGMFINTISEKIERTIIQGNYYYFAFFIPLFVNILWWTRDAFVTIPRSFCYGAIVLFLINRFLQLFNPSKRNSILYNK